MQADWRVYGFTAVGDVQAVPILELTKLKTLELGRVFCPETDAEMEAVYVDDVCGGSDNKFMKKMLEKSHRRMDNFSSQEPCYRSRVLSLSDQR